MARFVNDTSDSHPLITELGTGTYYWCQCGKTGKVPFCDGAHVGSGIEPLAFTLEEPATQAICNCGLTNMPPYCDGSHNTL